MIKKKVFFFTSNRSEYYILQPLINKFFFSKYYSLKIIVSSSHLIKKYGKTINQIDKRFKRIILKSKHNIRRTSYFNNICVEMDKILNNHKPNTIIILGDRFEAVACAITSFNSKIKIIHIHGGEKTIGSYDDTHRHVITKLANLHFCSENMYKKRILQLGENKKNVYNFGLAFWNAPATTVPKEFIITDISCVYRIKTIK